MILDYLSGDVLLAMGAGDEEVAVVGVTVVEVREGIADLTSPRLIDSRFWGGPLFDVRGDLAGVSLTAIGASRAITAGALRALVQRADASKAAR